MMVDINELKYGDLIEYSYNGEPWQLGRYARPFPIGDKIHILVTRVDSTGKLIREFPTYVAYKPEDVRKYVPDDNSNPNLMFKREGAHETGKGRDQKEQEDSNPHSKWRDYVKPVQRI